MATTTLDNPTKGNQVPRTPLKRPDEFKVVGSTQSLGYNKPQLMGRKLWLPMFVDGSDGLGDRIHLGHRRGRDRP